MSHAKDATQHSPAPLVEMVEGRLPLIPERIAHPNLIDEPPEVSPYLLAQPRASTSLLSGN